MKSPNTQKPHPLSDEANKPSFGYYGATEEKAAADTQEAGERVTSVTIGDGKGGGAGTEILQESSASLEIWSGKNVQIVPIKLAAAAPKMLGMLRVLSKIFNDSNFTDRGQYGPAIDRIIVEATAKTDCV